MIPTAARPPRPCTGPLRAVLVGCALALSGCFSVPARIERRPAFTTFNPTGTWFKAGRYVPDGSLYEMTGYPMKIQPASHGWFSFQEPGEAKPSQYLLADGMHLYRVLTGNSLYVLDCEGKDDPSGIWASPPAPLGYMEPEHRADAYPCGPTWHGIIARHVTGDGDYAQGFQDFETMDRSRYPLFRLDGMRIFTWDPAAGHHFGFGWNVGRKVVIAAATTHGYSYWRTYGTGTVTHHNRTDRVPATVALSTFTALGPDRMWVETVAWSTVPNRPQGTWLELYGRTPVTRQDFLAASCGRGNTLDCRAAAPPPGPR